MKEQDLLYSHFSIFDIMDNIFYSFRHPDEGLPLNGTIAFCGAQGSGKTLSAVLYVKKLVELFPDTIVCTNIDLPFLDGRFLQFRDVHDLCDLDNDSDGIVYLLDEMHILFNSLGSKNVDSSIFELVSQQRKQRKLIIGTTQVFGRLAKPFREQFKLAIICKKVFPHTFMQAAYKAETLCSEQNDDLKPSMMPLCRRFYTATIQDYSLYDTSQLIKGGLLSYE